MTVRTLREMQISRQMSKALPAGVFASNMTWRSLSCQDVWECSEDSPMDGIAIEGGRMEVRVSGRYG